MEDWVAKNVNSILILTPKPHDIKSRGQNSIMKKQEKGVQS